MADYTATRNPIRRDVVERSIVAMSNIPLEWNTSGEGGVFYELNLRMCHITELEYAFSWPGDGGYGGSKENRSVPDPTRILLLDLGVNDLTSLESNQLIMFTQLRALNASLNKITRFPGVEVLRCLQSLDLSHNEITCVGSEFTNCRQLVKLDLSVNHIDNISALPNLINLQVLHIHHNQLRSLDGIQSLPNLRQLYAHHNRLTDIQPVSACTALRLLDVSHNNIHSLDGVVRVLQNINSLDSLSLYNNPVSKSDSYQFTLVAYTSISVLDSVNVRNQQRRTYEMTRQRQKQPINADHRACEDRSYIRSYAVEDGLREGVMREGVVRGEVARGDEGDRWVPLENIAQQVFYEHLREKKKDVEDDLLFLNRQAVALQNNFSDYEQKTLDELDYTLRYLEQAIPRQGPTTYETTAATATRVLQPPAYYQTNGYGVGPGGYSISQGYSRGQGYPTMLSVDSLTLQNNNDNNNQRLYKDESYNPWQYTGAARSVRPAVNPRVDRLVVDSPMDGYSRTVGSRSSSNNFLRPTVGYV